MNSTVCTLFEGSYHFGVAALTNSLYKNGYRGIIWAGYKGELPPWASPLKTYENYQELEVTPDLIIRFIKLESKIHLSNYKPYFMLDLWDKKFTADELLFYFDPDIVVNRHWKYFEKWVKYGVALCEDVNSPMYNSHPLRMDWKDFFSQHQVKLNSSLNIYLNAGYIGLSQQNRKFLEDWKKTMDLIAIEMGGLGYTKVNINKDKHESQKSDIFPNTDQDALNVTCMQNDSTISICGKEGMGFSPGLAYMFHGVGPSKPWHLNFMHKLFKSKLRNPVEINYWKYVSHPIKIYPKRQVQKAKMYFKASRVINRIIK
ncbi:MAG: hypothetical protein ACNS62_07870 [Candidatus Cyclobacteriaceae bacterium M3_2C_046]